METSLRLDHLSLRVKDLEESIKFYQEVFGMQKLSQVPQDYAHLTFGGPRKTLSLIQGDSTSQAAVLAAGSGSAHFALEASDLKAFYRIFDRLRKTSYSYKLVDHDVSWAIYVQDPDSHKVEIFLWRQAGIDGAVWQGTTRFLADETIEEAYKALKSGA